MVLLLTSSTKLHKEGGAAQIRCAAERKGEAAIVNDCTVTQRSNPQRGFKVGHDLTRSGRSSVCLLIVDADAR